MNRTACLIIAVACLLCVPDLVFAQDAISIAPNRLELILGTKLEHNDYTGFEYQPSARLAWTPAASQTLWAAASRAVRTPSRIDRDLFVPARPPPGASMMTPQHRRSVGILCFHPMFWRFAWGRSA